MSKMKKWILYSISVVLGLLLTTLISIFFFTESFFTHIDLQRLAWGGVQERFEAGIQYFEKNECTDGQACQCVLLVHGLGDNIMTWSKTFLAEPSIYSTPVHFYAPNMPGTMGSASLAKTQDYNIQTVSQRLARVFLPKCNSWIVAGNSFGGWMAVDVALAGQGVRGLLLLDPAGLKKDYSGILDFFLHPTAESVEHFYHLTYAETIDLPHFLFERLATRLQRLPVRNELLSLREKDFLNYSLPKLKIPVTFVWGEQDGVIPSAWGKEYQAMTPHSQLKIVSHCGHIPEKECFSSMVSSLNDLMAEVRDHKTENVLK